MTHELNGDAPHDPILRVTIEYNPVNGEIRYASNSGSDFAIAGMLMLAQQAMMTKNLNAQAGGPRLVVPAPPRLS